MKVLVTGATGKVGAHLLPALLGDERMGGCEIVALCNNRQLSRTDRLSTVSGSLADPDAVRRAMAGVTHVVHMAAVKETPELVVDVALRGMLGLLEAFRTSQTARQFILLSGDCAVGHAFQGYEGPITEDAPRRAYPGWYALTKVIEEVMLEQYRFQYGLNGCCLRAPWIMEKDDLRFALAFGEDQFGGPRWADLMPAEDLQRAASGRHVPVIHDRDGRPLRRNFVHVSDVVGAITAAIGNEAARGETFNISMDEPLDYAVAAEYLRVSRGYDPIRIDSSMYSNWISNAKARFLLGWKPLFNLEKLLEDAWSYVRSPEETRKIWYPG